jgi:basic amino acid/polyamine antiporter, APA family
MSWRQRKSITALLRESAADGARDDGGTLRRSLGVWNLTSMGIGCTIGAGIFVLTGTAASYAGPAVAISFVAAALACLCSALCYAELASMIPVSGSAYTYAYATMGELVGWIVGWNLILEYLISASTVAVGWSAYVSALLEDTGIRIPAVLAESFLAQSTPAAHRGLLNLPAAAIMLASTAVLARGVRESALINNLMVAAKLLIIVLVIACGAAYIDSSNWHPFLPPNQGTLGQFGWSGVFRAAGVVFFAYLGFDVVSTSSQEARDPTRTIPLGLLIALAVCTLAYVGMSLVMTGLAPYTSLNVPNPVAVAVDHAGPELRWLKPLVTAGAMIGLASTILVTLYGQIRIFFSMARDGLIPRAFGRLHPHRVPTFGTWYCGMGGAIVAAVLPIEILGELVSIGTLLAFAIVCAGVLVLRRTEPNRSRIFRVPCVEWVAGTGIALCLLLMISLPGDTWIRLAVWLGAGLVIYFCYGTRHSKLLASTQKPGSH